jgi:hypothetical protein
MLTKKPIEDTMSTIDKECTQMYGFIADPTKPIWENIPVALQKNPTSTFLQTPYKLTCHNLCEKLQPPPGFNQLLGLGLNFCIEQYHPKPNIKKHHRKTKKVY